MVKQECRCSIFFFFFFFFFLGGGGGGGGGGGMSPFRVRYPLAVGISGSSFRAGARSH